MIVGATISDTPIRTITSPYSEKCNRRLYLIDILGLNPSSTSASFIRPTRTPDTPRSFVSALKWKYASEAYEDPSVQIVFVTQPGGNQKAKDPSQRPNQPIKFSGKVAEEVGFDKIRKQLAQLEELKIVILDGLRMWRPDVRLLDGQGKAVKREAEVWTEANDIGEACPKATDLDLSRNLFEEWREVVSICEQLNNLGALRVE